MTIPFWCIFAAFILCYVPKVPLAVAMAKVGKGRYDNNHPRTQQAQVEGWGARALAAHQNSFEGFPAFAAAVLVAHVAHADASKAGGFALGYVVSRIGYIALYLADKATLRSLVWGVGFAAVAGLFLLPLFG